MTPHHHLGAAFSQMRAAATRQRDKLTSGLPAPPRPVFVSGGRKPTCGLPSGFLSWLCVRAGGREERRRGSEEGKEGRRSGGDGGGGRSGGFILTELHEEPALPPCFHDDEPPTVFSCGTASASESSSQWRLGPSLSLLSFSCALLFSFFFLYCLCVF